MDPRTTPRITGAELARIVGSDKKPWQDYLVVDVRDSDWKGGNIKGSHNLPSTEFQTGVDELLRKTKGVPTVVFHCKFSQERGPVAAGVMLQHISSHSPQDLKRGRQIYDAKRSLQEAEEYKSQQVYVLQGGFDAFAATYKDDPLLVENWEQNAVIW